MQPAFLSALLFALVALTFMPCLRNGYISLDDRGYVSQNPHVQRGLTWEGLKWAWGSAEFQNWHPLTWMSHLLDGELFGLNPAGHHAGNVLLHAINSMLLFLLLRKMTGACWRSFVVAALWGVHPLRVESVAWVAERKDVLSAFFWMLTTWAYVWYVKTVNVSVPSPKAPRAKTSKIQLYYSLSLTLFALGLLAKPTLVTLPFTLLLLEYWPLRRWPQISLVRLLLEKVPFVILSLADSMVTYFVQQRGGAVTPIDTLSVPARIANGLVSYVRYLGKTVSPMDLSIIYPHPGHWRVVAVVAAGIFLAVLTLVAIWRRQQMPYLIIGWFWFLGTSIPMIGLIQVGLQSMADRYTYVPSIGLLVAMVWGAAKLSESWRHQSAFAWAFVVIVLSGCIVITLRQISYWKDSKALFGHAMNVTSRNWAAAAYLAKELQSRSEIDQAIAMYQESIKINPYHSEIRYGLADLLANRQRFDEALEQYRQAAAEDAGDFYPHEQMGGILQNFGRLDEAIDQYNQVIQLKPEFADAYSNLGNCYGMKGDSDNAIRCFAQAVKLRPDSAQNHRELGIGLANKGRWDEAIDQFQQALQLDPSDTQAQANLNSALQDKTRTEKSSKQ